MWFTVAVCATVGCRKDSSSTAVAPASSGSAPQAEESSVDAAQALQTAVTNRRWDSALQIAPKAMIANPDDPSVLTNVAIATANSGRKVEAANLLVDAARASEFQPGVRIDNAFKALLDVGHLHDAIELLENVVTRHPGATEYRRRLVGFLGEAQLTEEVDAHLSHLIRNRQFDLPLLLATTESNSRRYSPKTIDALLEKNPNDYRPKLGQAKAFLGSRDAESADKVLRQILERHPDFAAAHAMHGVALTAMGNTDALSDWFAGLPAGTSQYSGYWVALGEWSLAAGQTTAAIRAFAEATRRAPNDSGLWSRLGGAIRSWIAKRGEDTSGLDAATDREFASVIRAIDERNTDLLALRERFARFRIGEYRSQSVAVEIGKVLLRLGRVWESEAWLALATQLPDDPSTELARVRQQAIDRLTSNRDWQSLDGHPELAFDLDRFPLPNVAKESDLAGGDKAMAASASYRELAVTSLPLRLREQAEERQLVFYGRIGDGVRGPKVPIHQTLGCGGGVIDFDCDGRHDLVFSAAGGSPRSTNSEPGALFRNLGPAFADVTAACGFGDRGFGHGITVGDYNDDGFQDVLVLNLGRNRLFRNNGDGTFSDASASLGEIGPGDWSTSGAIVDIDGDGYNDVTVVNYCDADQPLDKPCFDSNGQEVNCYPLRYEAGRDRFLQGNSTGEFRDVTDAWATQPSPGRGLGVVAGCLDGKVQGVYVVNDASINQFYRWNRSEESTTKVGQLADSGVASGLAVDAQSLDQGSMGIASGDLDHDGDLDFYVTGFNQEYNIYYDQESSGFWSDQTAKLGLVADTRSMVGFGTEAIDFDNNGLDELLVANGHIGDFGAGGSPYAQPLQLFHRSTDGDFRLIEMVIRADISSDLMSVGPCSPVTSTMTDASMWL